MTLEELICHHEGCRLTVYKDTVGVETIGWGRNLRVGLSEEEALFLLKNDLARVRRELEKALPWFDTLSPVRQAVLQDMAYNLGLRGLLGFKQTLEYIRTGHYEEASKAMVKSKWSKQVGQRAQRLASMMRTDCWPEDVPVSPER
jgi:lysozyme